MSVQASSNPKIGVDTQGRRLESWKEIAVYLGRDVTTVRRWEKREGLPVRRLQHSRLGSVYAYTGELDAWRVGRAVVAAPGDGTSQAPQTRRRVWPVITLALLVLAGGLAWIWHLRRMELAASVNSRIRSLAVLPLQNLSGSPDQDYLADGMTEALIGRLSTIQGLRVISRTSSMQFKGTRSSVPEIARKLNVRAVVEGSVIRSGDRIRVTAQLIQGETDVHLWSGTFDRELRDVLALQSEVAQGIARQIEIALGPQSGSPVAARPVSPAVYESYLKGRSELHKGTRAGLEEAVRQFQDAIDADGKFAPAYAGLAATYEALGLVFYGAPPSETRPKVVAASRKALELDPELAEARALLANALQKDWHWSEAETEYRRAIELSPSDAAAHGGLADWLVCQGRTEEALASARRAQELDPRAFRGVQVGWILFQGRRFEEAIRELRTAVTIEPKDTMALWYLGFALAGAEQFDEAITTLEKAAAQSNRNPAVLGVLVRAYARGGQRTEALRVMDELHKQRQKGYIPAAAFLNAYLGLGDKEEAFAWLERAVEERSNIVQYLKVHPFFDPLRGDPRFAGFLRRANFSP
jgi:TolB-like protein/Flp pilus assembly protein TadD